MIESQLLKTNHYFSNYNYTNDLELLDVVLNIFSAVVLRNSLRLKERKVLLAYLKDGYSSNTKKSILLDLEMNSKNLDQINWSLTNKGFLNRHKTNCRLKTINTDLINLRDSFLSLEGNKSMYIIGFKKV